jgi:predicted O-methyltransferase YrrM
LSAIELRVFSHLTERISADSLAGTIGTHPDNTRLFLDALAANDLITKRGGLYGNTPVAETFLVEGRPTYIGGVLADDAEWMLPALDNLTALVRSGPASDVRRAHSLAPPQEAEVRANSQRSGFAQQAAAMISELPEFPRMRKMLDLGSGAGLVGLAIVAAHPTMTGVLFDRPEVAAVAERFVCEYELQDRVTTAGGDFSTDSIGEGYDLVWTSYTLNFFRDNLDPVMRKVHAALRPGGVCACVAEGLTCERTRPTPLINMMLAAGLTGWDVMFDEGEIAKAMLRAGFRSVDTRHMKGAHAHGPAVLDVARK